MLLALPHQGEELGVRDREHQLLIRGQHACGEWREMEYGNEPRLLSMLKRILHAKAHTSVQKPLNTLSTPMTPRNSLCTNVPKISLYLVKIYQLLT